jgi:2-methylcitrate dehydratase PrpD
MTSIAGKERNLDGLTMRYAEHVASMRYEDLPEAVVTKAKLLIRDSLGNQVAASAISEPAVAMVKLIAEWGGAQQSSVICFGNKVPTPHAAMCNAMLAHGVELDDAHGRGLIKAGSVLIPSLLALGEHVGSTGRELIVAIVAGYEVAVRIAKAINPAHRQRGYHTTGTVSLFGAAAGGAKLLGCNANEIGWALGLAGMQAAGIQSYLDDPCMAKPFSPGKAAFNGTLAAIMASRKFTGPRKVLECREGFFNAFADAVRASDLLEGLGTHYAIVEVAFKPHAACRYAHGPIDLAQRVYNEDSVTLEQVEHATVYMSELSIRQSSKAKVPNLNAAMGSTQFSIALALSRGSNGLTDYWKGFEEPELHKAAAGKITLVAEPSFGIDGRQAILEVKVAGGKVIRHQQEQPKGEPTYPMSDRELEAKFYSTSGLVIAQRQAESISQTVMGLEQCSNVADLPRLTTAKAGAPKLLAA